MLALLEALVEDRFLLERSSASGPGRFLSFVLSESAELAASEAIFGGNWAMSKGRCSKNESATKRERVWDGLMGSKGKVRYYLIIALTCFDDH